MSLSLFLALLAQTAAALPPRDDARFSACISAIDQDPEKGIAQANQWRLEGGNVLARQCLGMAYAAQKRWASAITAFQQAAEASEAAKDGRAASIWVQAGNAALASGDAVRARSFFDAAIILGTLQGAEAGEARLDRARALVATGDYPRARTDLEASLKLVPQDPLAWLLSAALARRMGDLKRAETDIGEAAKRAPDDASVALEAGNISALLGRDDAARTAWEAAVRLAPDSPQGKSAARALEQFKAGEAPDAAPHKP